MEKSKVYFPNLNGLRFIAALMVIVHHLEEIKREFNIPNIWDSQNTLFGPFHFYPFIYLVGKLGVILFFVLSGFLITYLLLVEEKSCSRISVRKFYVRRILRIWPLYFIIIVFALAVAPHIQWLSLPNYSKDIVFNCLHYKIILFALFLPNLVLVALGTVPYASHTWSIGTEEQYYLVWPVILKTFKKNRIFLMLFIISLYLCLQYFLQSDYASCIPRSSLILAFLKNFNIDCMAIGGIFALLLFKKNKVLNLIVNNTTFYLALSLSILLLSMGFYIPNYTFEFYAVLFGIIIINFASNTTLKISLENKVFDYLGKISYGLYMYHPICIVLCIKLLSYFKINNSILMYFISIGSTILLASFSYQYVEKFFIKLKVRFTDIISGDNAR